MSREKQNSGCCENCNSHIEEMAKDMCRNGMSNGNCVLDDDPCSLECVYGCCAERLYSKGYRKQSVGEWIEQVRVSKEGKPLLRHYKCNLCGVYLATQANFCPNCGAKMKGGAE